MSLPFLPGISLNPTAPRPRKQFFSREEGVTAEKSGSSRPVHKRQTAFGTTSAAAAGAAVGAHQQQEAVPAWLAFAGQSLRFTAYFQEAVTESASEHFKVRRVIIVFHLEDDSISVVEPAVANSGQPHGVLVRRHRIALPSDPEDHYMPDDFFIGAEVEFYGRRYRVIDCDEFTRNFYAKCGVELGEKEDYPEDQHHRALEKREKEKRRVTAPKPEVDSKAQFLKHDKDVLEFYCKWDEKRMFAEARKFRLQYFLADDQIQVVEIYKPNSGRDQSGPFLRKQKLRRPPELSTGGQRSLAVDPVGPPIETYHWTDLRVGELIDVLGRPFLLYDCDEHTKRFYKERLKIVFQPLTLHEPPKKEYAVADPPYNGWGSEEDSLLSSKSLVPHPPRQDVAKLLKNDRQVTRFAAKLVSRVEEDLERDFVVTFHLMDDTITIYEPAKRNSGMVSGKFLERQRIKRSPRQGDAGPGPFYYTAADLYVGARITANAHTFVLLETDEFSLNVMETRTAEFPRANLELIHAKLREFFLSGQAGASPSEVFASMDLDGNGYVSMEEFTTALRQLRQVVDLSDQEIIHLMRLYDTDGDGRISYQEFSAVITDPHRPLPRNPADQAEADARNEAPHITPHLVRDSIKDSLRALDEALRARRGQMLASFREFDRDGDSRLSLAEFRGMLAGINLALSEEQKDQLVNHFFGDEQVGGAQGKMGFQRFLVLLQREPTADVVLKGVNAFK